MNKRRRDDQSQFKSLTTLKYWIISRKGSVRGSIRSTLFDEHQHNGTDKSSIHISTLPERCIGKWYDTMDHIMVMFVCGSRAPHGCLNNIFRDGLLFGPRMGLGPNNPGDRWR